MMRMAKNEFVFERHVPPEELVSNLEAVTVDEVVEVAGDVFLEGEVSLVALGPVREEELDKGTALFR
jgi:predicted Zn-dependent peptidase